MPDELNVCDKAYAGTTGVTADDAEDATPVIPPAEADTVNVYEVPFVRPVTTIGELEPLAVMLPGDEVTVYVAPPFPVYAGTEKYTVALASPSVTEVTDG